MYSELYAYEKKVTCDMTNNVYDWIHCNVIIECIMRLKVILREVTFKISYKYVWILMLL